MANERMTLSNLAAGELQADFDYAMEKIRDSYEDEDLNGAPRKVKIEVVVTRDEQGRYFKTKHVVKTELPVKPKAGVAFMDGPGFAVEPLCRDTPQMGIPGVVTPITTARRSE